MLNPEPIGWINTGLPLVLLVGGAILLPKLLSGAGTRSHLVVSVAILSTAISLIVSGAAIFAAIYLLRGADVGLVFDQTPMVAVKFFVRLSGMAALAWGPILALVWFVMAQGVEKRRGEYLARPDAK